MLLFSFLLLYLKGMRAPSSPTQTQDKSPFRPLSPCICVRGNIYIYVLRLRKICYIMCIFFLNFNFFISSDIVKKRLNLFDACPPGFVNIMMIPSFIFRWLWRVIDCMYVRLPSAYDYVLIMSCLIYALRPWRLYQGVLACVFVCTRSHWLVHDCLIAVLLTLIPSGRSHPLSFFFFSHIICSPLSAAQPNINKRECVWAYPESSSDLYSIVQVFVLPLNSDLVPLAF